MSSTRRRVSSFLSILTWIFILSSWIPGIPQSIFGIKTIYIAFFMIFTRGIILNMIFGPAKKRQRQPPVDQNQDPFNQYQDPNQQYQAPVNARYCQSCGSVDDLNANFCQECGVAFPQENTTQSYK